MTLHDYTIEELKAELKRRNDLAKVDRAKVKRCRMCIHYGEVNYYGQPTTSKEGRGMSRCCQFFSWGKDNKYKKCHAPSQPACIYFEPIASLSLKMR